MTANEDYCFTYTEGRPGYGYSMIRGAWVQIGPLRIYHQIHERDSVQKPPLNYAARQEWEYESDWGEYESDWGAANDHAKRLS